MPALPTVVSQYVKRVIDSLKTGPGWASASLSFGSTTSQFLVTARQPGALGNSITVAVTEPSGTHALAVSVSGTAITIALSVSSGTHVDADNTAVKIVNAINASATVSPLVKASLTGAGTGSISAAVTVAPLAGGVTGTDSQPLNFLRAQDMASVLDLLQNALDQPATMTALTGSSSTVLIDGAGTFLPDQQVGNIVTFKSNTTTTALQGVSARILANTDHSLTLELLPGTIVNGDTYTITAGMLDPLIEELRQGKGLADAPPGSLYGDYRIVQAALQRLVSQLSLVAASDVLTFSGTPLTTETVTIAGKVYTLQASLTNVDGHVLLGSGGSATADTISNLAAAINLGAGSGTAYAAAMTINSSVKAVATTTTLTVTAKTIAGSGGNSIAVSETLTNATWASTTLTGGTSSSLRVQTVASLLTGSGSTTTQVVLAGGPYRIDQFRGMKVTISSEVRYVVGNSEDTLLLNKALTSAPTSGVAVSVTVPVVNPRPATIPGDIHPGGQPANNRILADQLEQAEALVIAFVLPA